MDGIPLWATNADDWCGCQDNPDEYWKVIVLHDIAMKGDSASFYWAWNNTDWGYHKYRMTAKKVDGKWMIHSMEGFKRYGTVDDYGKSMKGQEPGD